MWDVDENQMIGLKKRGDIKAFGVCDEQWQIDLRNQVLTYVGLPQYTKAGVVAAQYGFSEFGRRSWKCNVFVAHSAVRAGLTMPHNHHWLNVYPPVANDWANGTGIEGWSYLGRDVYLQPGYVAGHPATMGSGHCGVVDFDGWVVAAGEHCVNRRYKSWQDGATGFHKYGVQVNQGE